MPKRVFKPRTRKSGFRDAKLIVIATEGMVTETKYFNDLAFDEKYRNPKIHVEILERSATASAPNHIIHELDKFRRQFRLNEYDELWLVIDVDRWGDAKLSDIATQCEQKVYQLAVSNPCFELWLLLHVKSLDEYAADELSDIANNSRANGRTWLEKELLELCGSYDKSNLNTSHYIPYVETAIQRAQEIDANLEHRWPNQIGTRVYLLAKSIIETTHRKLN